MKFYSEYGEDKWLAQRDLIRLRGDYVDIGCGHPERGSNTAWLRDLGGWTGLAIDANPDYAPHWDAVPASKACFLPLILASTPRVKFKFEENSSLSRITDWVGDGAPVTDEGLRPARQLNDVLAEYGVQKIGLLSIDIEGAEYDVLSTLDLARHQPAIIIAEYATGHPDGRVKKDYRVFEHLMRDGNYAAVHQTVANIIYLRRWA
jgi:FkbM family methyltransferase